MIGGGPAGLSAAYQLALQGPRGDDLRRARRARRHDALRHSGLPHAARRARCRDPAHPRPRRDDAHELPHRHRHHAWSRSATNSTPCSSAWARRPAGRCRCEGADAPNCVTATAFLQGLQRRPPAARRQARGGGRRRRHLDRRGHGGAPPGPHRADPRERPPGARHRRPRGARRGRDLGQAGRRGHADLDLRRSTRCRPTSTRSSRRWPKASRSAAAWRRSAWCAAPTAAPPALRVIRCEAKIVGGRLEIKNIEGTEEDIPADLIVSAIGQAVDFTGLEEFNNGKGAHQRRQELPGAGPAGHVRRRRRGAPAPADHRDRPRRHRRRRHRPLPARRGAGQAPEDRRAHLRPDAQDGSKRGSTLQRSARADPRHRQQQRRRSTTSTTARTATSSRTRSCSSATSRTRRATGARSSRSTPSRRWATSRSACCR